MQNGVKITNKKKLNDASFGEKEKNKSSYL